MNRYIAIRSFISVLIWEHIVYLILLLITHNITYFKFLFLGSFLSCKLIWHSPYCRHTICHHIVGIQYVIYVSRDISVSQMITSVHTNRYMCGRSKFPQFWKVRNILFWVGRVLHNSPQKLGEFPPYSYLDLMCFDVPPIAGVWDIKISGNLSDWQIITSIHIYSTV